MRRSWPVSLLFLAPLICPHPASALQEPTDPERLQATCLGAATPGGATRIAVRWTGDEPLDVVVWGDRDHDLVLDVGEVVAERRTIDPGFTVIELEHAPEGSLSLGPETDVGGVSAALRIDGCAWSAEHFLADLDGEARAFAVYDDGAGAKLYVGGSFVGAADHRVNHVAAWDGTGWSALTGPGDSGTDGPVHALAVHASALYVGGDFAHAGGVAAGNIARWSGGAWSAVGSIDGPVYALISHRESPISTWKLYVGGSFGTAGGVSVANIARRSGVVWEAVGTSVGAPPGVAGPVYALERFTDEGISTKLYVGGDFTSSTGGAANHIARWDGTNWLSVGAGSSNGVDGAVRALEAYADTLWVGGDFVHAGNGILANAVAQWNGSAWSAMGLGMFFPNGSAGHVTALLSWSDGSNRHLYAGGWFDYAGGQPAKNLAVWTGAGWTGMLGSSMAGMSDQVYALGAYGSELYSAGRFTSASGILARRVARWGGLATETWRPLEDRWGWGIDGDAYAVEVFDEGAGPRLFLGGFFDRIGNVAARNLARWDGTSWSAVEDSSGVGPDNMVRVLKTYDLGTGPRLFVGGDFAQPGHGVVSWDGEGWQRLGPAGAEGVNGFVDDLQGFDYGSGPQLFVAGNFHAAGVTAAHGVARWDGATWHELIGPFSPPDMINPTPHPWVIALEVFDDGGGPALYVGGTFSLTVTPAAGIARWSGSAWSPVGGATDLNLGGIAIHDDGSGAALYVSGAFDTAGGTPASNLARWDGTAWSALQGPSGEGTDNIVWAISSYDAGDGAGLYVGGMFEQAGGLPLARLARWKDGAWSAVPAAGGSDPDGNVVRMYPVDFFGPSELWTFGYFTRLGETVSHHMGRWSCGLLFADDFETGDCSRWDAMVPPY